MSICFFEFGLRAKNSAHRRLSATLSVGLAGRLKLSMTERILTERFEYRFLEQLISH
ncbi:MAG: hypothetical protein P8J79_06130 [Halioglobus sp.]|nr:hypothetical protein [Halioglobus sp.]